jgi:hypothetical protein
VEIAEIPDLNDFTRTRALSSRLSPLNSALRFEMDLLKKVKKVWPKSRSRDVSRAASPTPTNANAPPAPSTSSSGLRSDRPPQANSVSEGSQPEVATLTSDGPSFNGRPPPVKPPEQEGGLKPMVRTGWNGFKGALGILKEVSGLLPPLQAAVGGLIKVIEVIDVRCISSPWCPFLTVPAV